MTQERLQELESALTDLDSKRATLLSEISSLRKSLANAPKERPLILEIKKVASFLGVSFDELCFGEEIQNKIETDISISLGDASYKVIFFKYETKRGAL